jgi:hypothetical protein
VEIGLAALDDNRAASFPQEVELPIKRASMRKIYEVLRLHFDLKLPQRQIARSIKLGQSTVNEYLIRFQQSALSWPLPEGYREDAL